MADALLKQAEDLAMELVSQRSAYGHIGRVERYLKGQHDEIYVPPKARIEYRNIAKNAVTNWLPNVSATFTRALFVDGYRSGEDSDNATPWKTWQANGFDAKQSVIFRGALEYGVSYAGVQSAGPGEFPIMKAFRPTRSMAIYEDDDDDWPLQFIYLKGQTITRERLWEFYDGELVYTITEDNGDFKWAGNPELLGFNQPPIVRFRDRLGAESIGVIEPLIPLQNRVNEIVFNTQMALQYASFRQRWATGLQLNFDPVTGDPIEPFNSAVDSLWIGTSPDTKFGEMGQTDLTGHIALYNMTIRTLAALGYIAPDVLTGDIINVSAETIALKKEATHFELKQYQTNLGESVEQMLRLVAVAQGDLGSANDLNSEVRWRATEQRPLDTVATALGILAEKLGIPQEELWPLVPDLTDGDLARMKKAKAEEPPPPTPIVAPQADGAIPQEGTPA